MTREGPLVSRVERLEALVERQAATIEAQRERIEELEAIAEVAARSMSISRRRLLMSGGLAGLLALGSGVASGDPQGRVGTADDPVGAIHAAALDGPVTGQQTVTDLLGDALVVDGGRLSVGVGDSLVADAGVLDVAVGPELAVQEGLLRVRPPSEWFSAASAVEPDDLTAVLGGMEGSGTAGDPYVVTDDHELQAMNADLDAHYRLGKHIDASETNEWHGGAGFEPIGDPMSSFTGVFDGDGRTIAGLTIDRPGTSEVGLFGFVSAGATIANVRVTDVDVTGNDTVGGLVGNAITSTVRESSVSGTVSAVDDTVGGLVGDNGADVSDSFSTASVAGSSPVGGLVGSTSESVETSVAAGSVSGSDGGGIAGMIALSATVADSYWDTAASGQTDAADAIFGTTQDLTGLTTAAMQGTGAATTMSALDFGTVWTTRSGDYPTLRVFAE